MAATYAIVVNNGESRLEVTLIEGDYSPVTDAAMPTLVWALAHAVDEVDRADTITVTRTSPVTADVPEV
ncbi:hypothetical protein [Streptomyces ortus]|uniref:Uncharacterized protein n=1 Tax=Streptomyces ortus TaxID=2867268 RepID=A0ABT3UWP4_9ACTN|nr:hypothetical protein [Streptomyces ortus]MCX4231983.1 hypothetical protein [Streptomyces ortus]